MRTALIASFAALAAAVEPQMDRGQILTWKELKAPETKDILVVGKPFEVTYFVFNMGKGDALNVKVKDTFPADNFEIVSGVPEKSWPVLSSGANETFSVTLKPKVTGVLQTARAQVDYQYLAEEDEPVDVTAYSTTPGRVEIVTQALYARYTATFTTEIAVALAAAALVVAWPAKIWGAAKAVNGGKKRA